MSATRKSWRPPGRVDTFLACCALASVAFCAATLLRARSVARNLSAEHAAGVVQPYLVALGEQIGRIERRQEELSRALSDPGQEPSSDALAAHEENRQRLDDLVRRLELL